MASERMDLLMKIHLLPQKTMLITYTSTLEVYASMKANIIPLPLLSSLSHSVHHLLSSINDLPIPQDLLILHLPPIAVSQHDVHDLAGLAPLVATAIAGAGVARVKVLALFGVRSWLMSALSTPALHSSTKMKGEMKGGE